MKTFKNILLSLTLFISTWCLSACTPNNGENLAKDLDSTVKNLVIAVSSLDWPQDGDLDKFNSIEHSSNATQTTDSSIVVDTQIDTTEIYTWLENSHSKINILLSQRGNLLLYLNEMYGGNTSLSEENILSLNVYMNILKDNSNYLSNYNGMLKNQINEANEIYANNQNVNLINAYLIKAVETLQLRCAKIDTSILAMSSIIDILKNNLINNYFNYNNHEIKEDVIDEPMDSKNDDNTQQPNISQNDNEVNDADNDTDTQEIAEQDNQQKAINFDSEIAEVENIEDSSPVPTDTPNYDDQIMTLEEPIIDDESEANNTLNEQTISTNISDNMQKNDKNAAKNAEIDNNITLNTNNNEENAVVTREIIKDNNI